MAELVDALDSKSSVGNNMSVRVRLPAPIIQRISVLANCIFCKIITKEIPSTIIAQNEQIIVIKDINPKAPIHYLIIPKKHIADISGFDNSDIQLAGQMIMMAKELAQQLPGSQAFKLLVNNGADVGQSVFHAHIHFLAGRKMADF